MLAVAIGGSSVRLGGAAWMELLLATGDSIAEADAFWV